MFFNCVVCQLAFKNKIQCQVETRLSPRYAPRTQLYFIRLLLHFISKCYLTRKRKIQRKREKRGRARHTYTFSPSSLTSCSFCAVVFLLPYSYASYPFEVIWSNLLTPTCNQSWFVKPTCRGNHDSTYANVLFIASDISKVFGRDS